MTADTLALLRSAEAYLSALHGSVARHDNLAANLGCAGCELRDQIAATLADQPTLRDQVAAAIDDVFTRWKAGLGDERPQDAIRDAVLAAVPAPVDRPAVLREAADVATQLPTPDCAEMSSLTNAWDQGTYAVAKELRRKADEAQQPEHSCGNCEGVDPDTCLNV
jgi:hypothetical protein